jgi:uncharacterized membrane protein YidH (DUF202 family)
MGSIALIVFGVALLAATGATLQFVRPKEGRPGPAWAQPESVSTALALGIVVGAVFGFALIITGALQ